MMHMTARHSAISIRTCPQFARALVISLLVALVAAASAGASGLPTVAGGATGATTFPDGTSLPTAVPLNGRSVSVASTRVSSLQAGETLDVTVEAEVTDDVIIRQGAAYVWIDAPVTSQLVLASSPEATTGTAMAPPAGGVISWREHHASVLRNADLVVPPSLQGQSLYVNLVLSSNPSAPPTTCFDYSRQSGAFVPAAAGCALHVENDTHLVDMSVLRTPAPSPSGFAAQLLGTTPASDAYLPVPADSSSPGYGQTRVVWSSAPVTNLKQGDIVEVSVQLQASITDLIRGMQLPAPGTTGCNVMLAGQLYLSPYPDRLPAAADPLDNAVPALDAGYAFNLTQTQPQALAAWHGAWTSDGNYTSAAARQRYVVLAVWASGASACQSAVQAAGGALGPSSALHVVSAGSSGFAIHYTPAASAPWGEGISCAGANAALQLASAGAPRVLSVVPVRLQAGDVLAASAEAAIGEAASGNTGLQLVLGTTYSGTGDASGTPLTAAGQASVDPGSDRALLVLRASTSGPADAPGAVSYVKLIGWSNAAGAVVDPGSTRLLVRLMRSGGGPSASDFPSPPSSATGPSVPSTPVASAPPAPGHAVPVGPPTTGGPGACKPQVRKPIKAKAAVHGTRPSRRSRKQIRLRSATAARARRRVSAHARHGGGQTTTRTRARPPTKQ